MYQFLNPEILKFCLGKTILYIKQVRPDTKLRDMYVDPLPTIAIKIYFTDSTSIQIDTWQGRYNTKDKQERILSYMTFLAIRKKRSLLPIDLIKYNRKRRNAANGDKTDYIGKENQVH